MRAIVPAAALRAPARTAAGTVAGTAARTVAGTERRPPGVGPYGGSPADLADCRRDVRRCARGGAHR